MMRPFSSASNTLVKLLLLRNKRDRQVSLPCIHPSLSASFSCAMPGEPTLKILLWKKDCLVFENTAPGTIFLSLLFIGSGLATAVSGQQEQVVWALCVGALFS
jgi:hypothetical protein